MTYHGRTDEECDVNSKRMTPQTNERSHAKVINYNSRIILNNFLSIFGRFFLIFSYDYHPSLTYRIPR